MHPTFIFLYYTCLDPLKYDYSCPNDLKNPQEEKKSKERKILLLSSRIANIYRPSVFLEASNSFFFKV